MLKKNFFLILCLLILFLLLILNFIVYYPFRIHNDVVYALSNPGEEQGLLITGLVLLLVIFPSFVFGSTFVVAILTINIFYFFAICLLLKKFLSLQFPKFLIIFMIIFFGFNSLVTTELSEVSKDSFLMVFLLFFIYFVWKFFDELKIRQVSKSTLIWFSFFFIALSEVRPNYLIVLLIFVLLFFSFCLVKKSVYNFRPLFICSFISFLIVLILNQCFSFFGVDSRHPGENLSIPLQMLAKVINSENGVFSNDEYASVLEITDGIKMNYVPGNSNSVKSGNVKFTALGQVLPLTFSVCSKNISTCFSAWFEQVRIVFLPTSSYRVGQTPEINFLMGYEMSYDPKLFWSQSFILEIRDNGNYNYYQIFNSKIPGLNGTFNFINNQFTKTIYSIHARFQFPIWIYFWIYFLLTLGFLIRRKLLYRSRFDLLIGSILAIVWGSYLYLFCGIPVYNSFYFVTIVICFPLLCLFTSMPAIIFLKKKIFDLRTKKINYPSNESLNQS